MQFISWAREPRLGEARKPGPHAAFDNESDDAWSEFGDLSQLESEQPECWMLPPTEIEAAVGADAGNQGGRSTGLPPAGMDHKQLEAGVRAERTAVEKWCGLHANDAFVPVQIKRITKASKFDGAKPGWVF